MSAMMDFLRGKPRSGLFHYRLERDDWIRFLALPGRLLPLLASWADEQKATILLLDGEKPVLISTSLELRRYHAPSSLYPVAAWGERMARDLWGVEALSAPDDAPALDDGSWAKTWPLSREGITVPGAGLTEPKGLYMSPCYVGLPGLVGLEYTLGGEGRLETVIPSIASAHRGVLSQLKGLTPEQALPIVARISAGGFVAHPVAFLRAVEQAGGIYPVPHERDTRLLLLEIERISLHLFDLSQTARLVQADLFATLCDQMRETLAALCASYGFSRRLTDVITLDEKQRERIEIVPLAQAVREAIEPKFSLLSDLYALYGERFRGYGVLSNDTVWHYAIGGTTGRASGRYIDMRRSDVGMRLEALRSSGGYGGDAHGRNLQRLSEIRDSLALIEEIIASFALEDETESFPALQEGLGVVESARGDIWYWLTLKEGRLDTIQIRDPALPVLTAFGEILRGEKPDSVPLILASFGFSPAGLAL
ncbi:hypothetical protein PT277_07780 [Acetobacteraceae bacterium ESL0709]|nr:hypothetical protein [Acetobacteraceae bacterium ESL0709]